MDRKLAEELRNAYLVARLNVEKSERTVGHLARHLARPAIVHRLARIAVELPQAKADRSRVVRGQSQALRAETAPVPFEVSEALRELRDWRDATLRAYQQIPEADRAQLPLPALPWSLRGSPVLRVV
jgi:hypothetical protein